MTDAKTQEAAAHFALAETNIRGLEDYLRRGRQFEPVDILKLTEMFVAALELMAANPLEQTGRTAFDDLEAEFGLRGIEPPYDQARDAVERLARFARETIDNASAERRMAWNDSMLEEYAAAKKRTQ